MSVKKIAVLAFFALLLLTAALPGWAGTTGGVHGRVTDLDNGQPIADAVVSVTSPSQSDRHPTDASGYYSFISLAPDTYAISASKDGYTPEQVPGVTIISDQNRSIDIRLQKSVKTLARVAVRGTGGLVRGGVTSDVYSINSAGQKAAAAIGGSGGINQAYGAIASAPGVNYDQGQQGWYQNIFIRGGDIDQVAYEFDGIPTMRVSDQATVTTLTSLGQQEVQVYAGGTPASADAPGLAGYINQVIKTGTYPGYGYFNMGFGTPALYNKAGLELAGATPDRNFTYYIATQLVAQGYRYADQNNGAGNPLYFYPLFNGNPAGSPPTPLNGGIGACCGVWDGTVPFLAAPGPTNAIAYTNDRETIMNFHFGLQHKHDSSKDDIQLLYDNSLILQKFYGSQLDQGINNVQIAFSGSPSSPLPLTYFDGFAYNGPVFAPPDATRGSFALFPNSPQHRAPFAPLPVNEREGSQNGVALLKFQYQRNIDTKSYLRFFAYTDFATWLISGPVSADLPYAGQLGEYTVIEHKYGGDLIYSRQLSDKHLLNLTTSYLTASLETYNAQPWSFLQWSAPLTNLIDAAGNCYDATTGFLASCFPSNNNLTLGGSQGTITGIVSGVAQGLTPGTPPAGSPAALANAQWIVTEDGRRAQIDTVKPFFTGYSVTDQWHPNSKMTVNLGMRLEDFAYRYDDLASAFPARQFWFNAYNREFCFGPGNIAAVQRTFDPLTGAESACPAGTSPTNVQNFAGGTHHERVWQPRLGATYQVSPDLVLRATYGRYARPAATSYQEFTTVQQNSATFVAGFLDLGYNTPIHNLHADTANNYDFSIEQHLRGTDMSYKLTPYYRNTQGQVQFISLNAQGVLAGVNAGLQRSYGLEFAFNKGDFGSNGFSLKTSITLLRSRIKYGNQPSGNNVIDLLNTYIRTYNSFTSACGPGADPNLCGNSGGANAQPSFTNSTSGVITANPYFNMAPQPLFDRNGEYTTYSTIPSPFNNANSYETPFATTVILNYKHKNWNVTPSFTYSGGASYGSPLVWPGYDPSTCGNTDVNGNNVGPSSCGGFLFIPDKYTGHFDSLGAFKQPARLTANLSVGWQPSERVNATFTFTNLVDHCFQRSFPWDSATTCIYGQLPSNLLAPAGNFVANPPIQLAFPYGSWYNNTEIGQEGQKSPPSVIMEVQFKL